MTYVALQLVGLLGVLDIELLGVAGVVVELLAVGEVTGLSLTLLGLQELGLVSVDFVVRAILLGLTFVLQVALEFAGCQRVHHLGVVLHAAQPHLLALLFQMGLLVMELLEGERQISVQKLIMLHLEYMSKCSKKKDREIDKLSIKQEAFKIKRPNIYCICIHTLNCY